MIARNTDRLACMADFTFRDFGAEPRDWSVTGFSGEEAIGELFHFRVELRANDADLRPVEQLGKPCLLRIDGPAGGRDIHALIARFEKTGVVHGRGVYAAEIVPAFWLLSKRHRSRIFQAHNCPDMTAPGIVRRVFETAGVPDDQYEFRIHREHPAHDYIVQYRESELSFVQRLLEEAGIFYFFEDTPAGWRLVLGDSPQAHSRPQAARYEFREADGLARYQRGVEFVHDVREQCAVQTGAVSLDDFDFRRPGVDLISGAVGDAFPALEFSDYPGRFTDKEVGRQYAELRLDAQRCGARVLRMSGDVRTLAPGQLFELGGHPDPELNGAYLVTRMRHRAVQPAGAEEGAGLGARHDYAVELEAIPEETPFRPRRTTPRPVVHGSQTAIVVGPKSEEIFTDEYGRVKVQFPWDRDGGFDEFSSCWIRVSQGMAGGRYGMQFLPRVGQEVIVDFLEGDPDRPIITGRVYNNDHMPPYPLPDEKTRSGIRTHSTPGGGGCNEIRFEDRKDAEQLLLHAERRMDTRVKASHHHTVGGDYHLLVGGEHKGHLSGEYREKVFKAKHTHVKGERRTWIEEDESLVVGGDAAAEFQAARSVAVKGPVLDTFGESHKHEVAQTYDCEAGAIKLCANQTIEIACGPSRIVLSPSGVFIEGPMIHLAGAPGPYVPPVNLIVTGPAPPEEASAADRTKPGRDTRYDKDPDDPTTPDFPEIPDPDDPDDVDPPTDTAWVEIELIDQNGEPVPGEPYRLIDSAGRVFKGSLDQQGFKHIDGVAPGECQVTFPKRDRSVWRRATLGETPAP